MLSPRRMRVLAITAVVVVVMYLYYSGEGTSVQNQRFYQSTIAAIDAQKAGKNTGSGSGIAPGKASHNDVSESRRVDDYDPGVPAIPKANSQELKNEDIMEEIPIAGRTVMTVAKDRNEVAKEQEGEKGKKEADKSVDDEKEVKAELNAILKRSPIIILSKSYCPYSKKAKHILLNKYSIVPAPFVVELDQHPLGRPLQDLLGERTGRHTVPNVLVGGKSIGGGDDVAAMDEHDELASTLKKLGGGWLQEVSHVETAH